MPYLGVGGRRRGRGSYGGRRPSRRLACQTPPISTSPLPSPSAGVRASSIACAVGSSVWACVFTNCKRRSIWAVVSPTAGDFWGCGTSSARSFCNLRYTSASSSRYRLRVSSASRLRASSASVITSVCLSTFSAKLFAWLSRRLFWSLQESILFWDQVVGASTFIQNHVLSFYSTSQCQSQIDMNRSLSHSLSITCLELIRSNVHYHPLLLGIFFQSSSGSDMEFKQGITEFPFKPSFYVESMIMSPHLDGFDSLASSSVPSGPSNHQTHICSSHQQLMFIVE